MSEKTLLPPSLRVENGDYHGQAAEVMRSLIRFYDSMIKLGPVMKISNATLDKLKVRAKLARDNLRKFIHLVPARKDKLELHILTYKKRLTEHCHLQHTLEIWKSALRNFSSLPQVPAEMLDFPPTYGLQPVTQMIDKILTDCSLPFDLQQLRAEMVEMEVKSVAKRKSAILMVEKKDYHVNEPYDNSYKYIYPPGFTPSAAMRAFLEEQVPTPKKTYVLPPDIFEKRKKVLPDISGDLQKEMERLAAQNTTSCGKSEKESSEFGKPIATVKKDKLRNNIDRYDEYLKIKKIMQGLIRPDNSSVGNTTLVGTTDKQRNEEPSSQKSELSDFVKRNLTTLASGTSFEEDSEFQTLMGLSDVRNFSLPGAVQDNKPYAQERQKRESSREMAFKNRKRQRQTEAPQEKTLGYSHFTKSGEKIRSKHTGRAMKQRHEKTDRDIIGDGKDLYNEEPASKRLKASPIQLSFLKSASVQGFKIPKRSVKCSKCLEIPKVGLKRKGYDAVETERCGKRSRNH